MEWYLKVLKEYANFKGRARRKEYWMFVLVNMIISFVIGFFSGLIDMPMLGSVYSLVLFLPSLAVGARRLHDINKSGWYLLLMLLPLIGWVWLIILHAKEGDEGPNEYGADPKNPTNELDEIGVAQ